MRQMFLAIPIISVIALLPVALIAQTQSVQVEGYQIYYQVAGSGAPVLVFHGWTQTGEDWQKLLTPLEKNYQLIYVDLPGHGKSRTLIDPFSVQATARQMYAFVEKLRLEGARAIGYSYGGMVLLEILAAHPTAFREVVLVGTPHKFAGGDSAPIVFDSLPAPVLKTLLDKHVDGQTQVRKLFDPTLDYAIDIGAEDLRNVFIPILLVGGERDIVSPAAQLDNLHRWFMTSELWIIPEGTHNLITTNNNQMFVDKVRAFFSDF